MEETTLEACLEDFRSMDAEVRMTALERMLTLDDSRVAKCLEALVDDPSMEIARRAREELALRTGEAIGQKWAAPDLGNLGMTDYLAAGTRLLGLKPVPLLGVTFISVILMPVIFLLVMVIVGVVGAVGLTVIKLVFPDSLGGNIAMALGMCGMGVFFLCGMIVFGQVPNMVAGLLAWVVSRIYLDEQVGLVEGCKFVLHRLGPLIRTVIRRSMLILKPVVCLVVPGGLLMMLGGAGAKAVGGSASAGLAVVGGLLAAIGFIMALLAGLRYSFADVVCATGGIAGDAACQRSLRLWTEFAGRIIGTVLLMWLVAGLLSGGVQLLLGDNILIGLALNILVGTWCGLTQVVMYYDLCARMRLNAAQRPGAPGW